MEKAKLKKQEINNGEASAVAVTDPKRRRPKLLSVITRILAKRSPLAKSQSSPAKAQASSIQVPVGNWRRHRRNQKSETDRALPFGCTSPAATGALTCELPSSYLTSRSSPPAVA
jgi:hypothetical protein